MLLRPFAPDRHCPHCQSAASLYLEEIGVESDIVCIICGYRRISALRRPPRGNGPRKAVQGALPITASPR